MAGLYALFKDAPVLGSLIEPHTIGGDLLTAEFHDLQPLLAEALAAETSETRHELAVTAQGLTRAAEILAGSFHLVATNVPYLARGKQSEALKRYCETRYPRAKNDLANCFLERCLAFADGGAGVPPANRGQDGRAPVRAPVVQVVMPQNWLFLTSYRKQRERLLRELSWNLLGRLGPGAFETISGEVVNAILLTLTNHPAPEDFMLAGIDVSAPRAVGEKAEGLRSRDVVRVSQAGQLGNPDARIAIDEPDASRLLSIYADCYVGLQTSDAPMFVCGFWEVEQIDLLIWEPLQGTPEILTMYAGASWLVRWEEGTGMLLSSPTAYPKKGEKAIGHRGIVIHRMGGLFPYWFAGTRFHQNVAVIVPREPAQLAAIWCFCSSPAFNEAVRQIDQSLRVTNATFVKVPFDLAHWQKVAAREYPNGLPKPHSDDPAQWLFNGHPKGSEEPLQVAVARLLGYRWPRQTGSEFPDCPALGPDGLEGVADADGICCLPPINKEQPAAARLRNLLAAAFGSDWSPSRERDLLAATGAKQTNLEDWLRASRPTKVLRFRGVRVRHPADRPPPRRSPRRRPLVGGGRDRLTCPRTVSSH